MGIVVGVDASRNRSGGARAHIIGILKSVDPTEHGVDKVHLWSYRGLLDAIPDAPWLVKHSPPELERSLLHQVAWQYRLLPGEARRKGCDILLNTDAGTVCPFAPAVTMSRDMLSYEAREMNRFGLSPMRLRLLLLKYIQSRSLKKAQGAIFLTEYASGVIQDCTGPLENVAIVPHGIGENFRRESSLGVWNGRQNEEIRCIYVSNALLYKHQWHVIRAFSKLRAKGHKLSLLLVGGGEGKAQEMLLREMALADPRGEFVRQLDFVEHGAIPDLIGESDIFIFASSCENMPNTLVEGMAGGIPIASSDRGPMPEVLRDGGVYFDPENPDSIATAVERIVADRALREGIAKRAKLLSEQYSWQRCAAETYRFLGKTALKVKVTRSPRSQIT